MIKSFGKFRSVREMESRDTVLISLYQILRCEFSKQDLNDSRKVYGEINIHDVSRMVIKKLKRKRNDLLHGKSRTSFRLIIIKKYIRLD